MKKEIIAAAILVLLLVSSLINARVIEKKTGGLSESISKAEEIYLSGEKDEAMKMVAESLQIWLDWEPYTHIMLRHSETELVIDGFFDLLGELEREEGATAMDYERLRVILEGISRAEQVRWGSIL